MWKSPLRVVHRIMVPLLLVAGGIAAIVMGQWRHAETVYAEHQEETSVRVRVAAPQMPPGFPGQPFNGPGGMPLDDESQFRTMRMIETVRTTSEMPESNMVREITFGGLERREGQLWQTYSGKPPALCPT